MLLPVLAALALLWPPGQGAAGEPATLPPILAAAEDDYPPFSVVDAEGRADGFSVELLRAALAAMGREVDFRTGTWPEVRGWLERGEVEALPLVGRTPEREPLYDFTFPYMTLHGAIVVRKDDAGIEGLGDLRGRQVAVMAGDNAEEFLRRQRLDIDLTTTESFDEALRQLAAGQHDAVVMQRLVAVRLVELLRLDGLRVLPQPVEGFQQDFCFAVREGDRDTLALLNEGLSLVIADGTHRRLHARWFAALELPSERRVIVGGDHAFPPFEYLDDDGRPAGFNVDLTRAIARTVGLEVEIRLGPWTEILEALDRGDVDLLQGMFYSSERDERFDFTAPHTSVHYVAVVREEDGPPPERFEDLAGLKLVVQQGDVMHDLVLAAGLGDRLTAVESQEAALRALAAGAHDCVLVARPTASYWIEKHGLRTLTIARRSVLAPEYCIAVGNGRRALLAAFSEGLAIVEDSGEYRRIHERWLGVSPPRELTLADAVRRSATVVAPLVVVLLLAFFWSWMLRRQVAARTAALAEGERRLKTLFVNLPGMAYRQRRGANGPMDLVSEGCVALTGYHPEELTGDGGVRYRDLIHPADRESIERHVQEAVSAGAGYALEYRLHPRDGAERWVWEKGRQVPSAPGDTTLEGFVADVTERVQAEQAARDSATLVKMAGSLARLGGWSVDVPPQRVVWSDEVALIHHVEPGYSPSVEEGIGFYAPEHRERIAEVFGACVRDGAPYDEELQIVTATGRRVWVRTMGVAERDASGRVVRVQGAFQDISERRSLEDQLVQAQKMEAVGRLAGGVAHDFNNMLGVIIVNAELARESLDAGHPAHADLGEILSAAQRSAALTRQLLGFARRQTIAPRRLDLNETVEGMLTMLRRLVGEGLELVWRPAPALWPVCVDPGQVHQVLANLCVNARDAIAGVGQVVIETANVTVDEAFCHRNPGSRAGDMVTLEVRDDGAGMDREALDHLFEPFFTTKGVGQGTGLGLATVHGIAHQNGGFVLVDSRQGAGTTVSVFFARDTSGDDAGAGTSPSAVGRDTPEPSGETLLVVEDEPAILRVVERGLQSLGYRVLTAGAPEQALALSAGHPGDIDLLISDVVMPGMDGRTLAARLRADRPGLDVLFMSGYTADVIASHGVLDDGLSFIQKPFSIDELTAKVSVLLGDRRRREAELGSHP